MTTAIDRELAGDINNPSTDVSKYCIAQTPEIIRTT